jgi:hypothetical protein
MLPSTSVDPAAEAVMVTGAMIGPLTGAALDAPPMVNAAVGGWLGTTSCTPAEILLVSDGLPVAYT